MPTKLAEADQMTVEEFLAFYEQRPDGEKWELIEGAAVMNPSPTQWHQVIAGNILFALSERKIAEAATWIPLMGIGTHVPNSPHSLPQPDVYVQSRPVVDAATTDDALAVFEVLSQSNTKADQAWRRRVYASIPNCRHYVTVATKSAEVTCYDRADQWRARTLKGLDATLQLSAINAAIPLRLIYRWTPIE
ncbi:MAG TPA: Uma2 family endonuclease [Hyphomicrobiaceae bacterium]|nr:Uma2 family endonuclease [Hyphomicrobiaceae bacterium]